MIPKLLTSALLALALAALLLGSASVPSETRTLVTVLLIVLVGWHRVLLPTPTTSRWSGLWTPDREQMYSLDTIWGVPIRRPRGARVSLRAQRLTERMPRASRAVETLPVWLLRPLRRLLAYRHDHRRAR